MLLHKPIHIMHVIDGLAIGGAERVLIEIVNHTNRKGFRASVCITRSDRTLAATLNPGIDLFVLERQYRFDIRGMYRFLKLLDNGMVDLLHVHSRSTLSFVSALRTLVPFKRPQLIFHDHYGKIEIDNSIPLWFRVFGKRKIDHYVGVSAKNVDWALAAGIPYKHTSIIQNALNLDKLWCQADNIRKEFTNLSSQLLGVILGNIRNAKGVDLLIQAVAQSKNGRDAKYLVVGGIRDKDYFQSCLQMIKDAHLTENFLFLGPRMDIANILQSVNFAVLPSRTESGPLVLIEYAAVGLPFVSTDVGYIGRTLSSFGVQGFIPPGDVLTMAEKIDELIGLTEQERQHRGSLGQQIVMEHFDIKQVINKWFDLYVTLVNRRC